MTPDDDNNSNGNGSDRSGLDGLNSLASGNGQTSGANPPKATNDKSSPPAPPKPLGNPGLYGRLRSGSVNLDPRAEVLESVRERVHRRVISELGPVFYTTRSNSESSGHGSNGSSRLRCATKRRPCLPPSSSR